MYFVVALSRSIILFTTAIVNERNPSSTASFPMNPVKSGILVVDADARVEDLGQSRALATEKRAR